MAWQCGAKSNAGLIENMIRAKIIHTEVVRDAFLAVDRAWFVPRDLQQHAYEDRPLPIGYGVTISAPHMHAAMAELMVKSMLTTASGGGGDNNSADRFLPLKGKRILDVGSGSGFLTAAMAHIVGPTGIVHGIEHVPELVASSTSIIKGNCGAYARFGDNFNITVGDGRIDTFPQGFLEQYDAIHVGAAAPGRAPQSLLNRLAPHGCLVIPIDDGLHVIHRSADGKSFSDKIEMGVRFVPLTDLKSQLTQY